MGRKLAVGAVVFGGITLLGLPLGVLWWLLAPRPEATVTSQGLARYPLSQSWFAVDGWYSVVMLAAGLAVGYTCYLLQQRASQRHGLDLRLPALIGVVTGTLAGSCVAWGVGAGLDLRAADAALLLARPGDVVRTGLTLRSYSALLLWSFSAVLQYGLFEALTLWQEERADPGDGS
ncbi:hypothetical protein [Thermobifida cellulosilytica]|uniref:DUF2567 domain-containing protein n=1 Tax=Thermobifida cellulosilytica TB100 TaxID=665004 RepID=A0A147KMP3_THECS|nr:hypothetical protein [Thermobifida cellulosilytica]KUP98508.1 hypothetical protein AC529_00740 [Thermobifida cellulosilytica TB100]